MNRLPRRTDKQIGYDQYARMSSDVSKLNNIRFDPSVFNVIDDNTGTYVSLIIPEETKIPTDFGIKSVSGTNVIIYGGDIIIGDAQPVSAGETTLTVNTETAILGLQYSFADDELSIVNFGSEFLVDTAYIRKKLYTFEYKDNSLKLIRIHNMQMFPANFGAS